LTSITLPANVQLGKDKDAFTREFLSAYNEFVSAYEKNRKRAGTYTRVSSITATGMSIKKWTYKK
jgi:hypothetical protein